MATASLDDVLPGWSDRALLVRMIERERPAWLSLRSTLGMLGLAAASVVFALAGWVGARYLAMRADCASQGAWAERCLSESPIHPQAVVQLVTLGVGLVVVSLMMVAWWWSARRSLPTFVDLLTRRAKDVCWVYVRTTTYVDRVSRRARGTSADVMLCTTNGHVFSIPHLPVKEAEAAAASMVPLLPWATFGHQAAHDEAYRRDPRSLFRA